MQRDLPPAAYGIGCLILLAAIVSLGVSLALFTGVLSPPKNWGANPFGSAARESGELLDRLDPSNTPDPRARVLALERIFGIGVLGAIQQAHVRALEDPDETVRTAVLQELDRTLRENPGLLIRKSVFGLVKSVYVDFHRIGKTGREDPSSTVRAAVAAFWGHGADFRDEALDQLREMLNHERDERVQVVIRGSIARLESK
jgi:hypothetical protein